MKTGIIFGILLCTIAFGLFASEKDGIFSRKIGKFEVFTLVEAERDGNTAILVDADEELLAKYIPEEGFRHTANAFLVKAGRKNFLIDTGTGVNGIIVEKLKKLGVQPEKINAVLITHLHGDHFGGLHNAGVANFPKAKIYVSANELEFFTKTNVNEGAVAALAPYGKKVISFTPGIVGGKNKTLVKGITALANYGHTPGHTVFLVENKKDRFIVAGDFLHVALVQFARPDISATFDVDKEAAAAARRNILDYAAKNKIPIGGMHIVYPGMGTVEPEEEGFKFTPFK